MSRYRIVPSKKVNDRWFLEKEYSLFGIKFWVYITEGDNKKFMIDSAKFYQNLDKKIKEHAAQEPIYFD